MGGLNILGSAAENTNETKTTNTSGGADGNGFNLITSESSVNVLDGGAIDAIAGIAYKALENEQSANNNALKASDNALGFAYKAGAPDAAGRDTQTYVIGGAVVLIMVAMFANKNKSRK